MFGRKSKKKEIIPKGIQDSKLQENVLNALSYGDLDDRLNAVRIVSTTGEAAITILLKALDDDCWIVRRTAANFLSQLGVAAIPALISCYSNRRPDIHNEILHAFLMMGPVVLENLYPELRNGDPMVRVGVVETIGGFRSRVSLQYLINVSRDPDAGVRREVAKALGKMEGKDAVITLLSLLHDTDGEVSSFAADSLLLLHEDATDPLIKALSDSDRSVRRKAEETLAIGGKSVTEKLIHATGDNNPDIREGAVRILGKMMAADAITALVVSLEDTEAGVRSEAVNALINYGGVVTGPLTEALHSDNLTTRNGAMECLARIGPPAVPALIALTKEGTPFIRKISCSILGETGGKEAETALREALNDEVMTVRREAFESLEVLRGRNRT